MDDCIFCMIASGKIPCAKVFEDDSFVAFLDINPINPGHTLVIPKKHVESVFELDKGGYSGLFEVSRRLSAPIQKAMGARRMGLVIEGFLVPHAHIHLVPLNNGGELSFSRAKKAEARDLATALARIRQQL